MKKSNEEDNSSDYEFVEDGHTSGDESSRHATPQLKSEATNKSQTQLLDAQDGAVEETTPLANDDPHGSEVISWRQFLKETAKKPDMDREEMQAIHDAAKEAEHVDEELVLIEQLFGTRALVFAKKAQDLGNWLDDVASKAEEKSDLALAAIAGLASSVAQNVKQNANYLAKQAFVEEVVAETGANAERKLAELTDPNAPAPSNVAVLPANKMSGMS